MMNTVQLIDRKGKTRTGRKVVITTTFDCNVDAIWQRIQNLATLVEICKPMARFSPFEGKMPMSWIVGKSYDFNLYLHCILPLGKHTIIIESMDQAIHQIQSREHNTLVPVWNHLIKMNPTDNKVEYTDELEIYVGVFTGVVGWWNGRFYRHRQRKWKEILGR